MPSKKHSNISLTPSAYLDCAVKDGQLAGMGAHSYSKGTATGGSEEAAKYKKK